MKSKNNFHKSHKKYMAYATKSFKWCSYLNELTILIIDSSFDSSLTLKAFWYFALK